MFEKQPTRPSRALALAQQQWDQGDWEGILAWDQPELETHPDGGELLSMCAAAQIQLGHHHAAHKLVQRAHKCGATHDQLSRYLFERKKLQVPLSHSNQLRYTSNSTETLATNLCHQFALDYTICHFQSDSLITFIPKNACTTLRYSLGIANGCIRGEEDFNWIHQNNNTFKATLRDLVCAKYSCVILRCPFTRIASAFLDIVVKRREQIQGLSPEIQSLIDSGDLSFRDFVELLKISNFPKSNVHWMPQTKFLIYQNYQNIFRMEDIKYAFSQISKKLNINILDTRKLSKHGLDQYRLLDGEYSNLKSFEILKMQKNGTCPNYASLFDFEILEIIRTVYSNDIDLYISTFSKNSLKDSPVLSKFSGFDL